MAFKIVILIHSSSPSFSLIPLFKSKISMCFGFRNSLIIGIAFAGSTWVPHVKMSIAAYPSSGHVWIEMWLSASTATPVAPWGENLWVLTQIKVAPHAYPEYSYAALDVFTCGEHTDPYKALEVIREFLKPKSIQIIDLKRGLMEMENGTFELK